MSSAILWGVKVAVATVLAMLGIWLISRVVGWAFAIVIGVVAGVAFTVIVVVALVLRLIGAGISRFAEILTVDQDEKYDRSAEMAREIASAPGGSDELLAVASRIRRLTKAGHSIAEPRLARAVAAVSGTAERLLAKAARSRADARRLRPALVHRLGHVEAVTLCPRHFATVREAAKRTLGQRHFDVQLIGGMVLHEGRSPR
jgi:hypothetical protein